MDRELDHRDEEPKINEAPLSQGLRLFDGNQAVPVLCILYCVVLSCGEKVNKFNNNNVEGLVQRE